MSRRACRSTARERQMEAVIGGEYNAARECHGIKTSKALAAQALVNSLPGLTYAEADDLVERWYVGDRLFDARPGNE